MDNHQSRRMAFLACLVVAVLCILGVLVAVVDTGRDGSVTDWLTVAAVAALILAWRLHRQLQRDSIAD